MTAEPTPQELPYHELVGLECRVASAPDDTLGIEGLVVDESLHTISIEASGGVKQVQKAGRVFEFTLQEGVVQVEGDAIEERPVDRLKMKQASVGGQ